MISVEHLTKYYGDFKAVDDLSFEIEDGHVYGFLGPNGAGKSTTMNIMTGCLSATSGQVKIDGHDIFDEPKAAKRLIGYLPEQPPLYMNETPEEYLKFVGEAKGLKGDELKKQIDAVIESTKLQQMRKKRISDLSKGYKQRVGIAQAIIGDPKVIILDEPTVGLDPRQIIEIRDLIKELGEDHTVILSSHILPEVQEICEKVLVISNGKLRAFDEPEKLERTVVSANEITITVEADEETAKAVAAKAGEFDIAGCESKEGRYTTLLLKAGGDDVYEISKALFFAFAAENKAIVEMKPKKATLEDLFIELTENSGEASVETDEIEEESADESQPDEKDEPENEEVTEE